jgi:hypothetical protein
VSSPLDGRSEAEKRIIALAIQRIYQRRAAAKGGESGADFVARTKAQTAAQNPGALPGDQLEAEAKGFWEPLVTPDTYRELATLPSELVEEARRHPVQSAFDRQAGLIKGMLKGGVGLGALAVSAADLLNAGPGGIPARIQAGATKGGSVLGPVAEAVDATDRAAMAVLNRVPGRDPNAATTLTMALSDEVGQAIDVNPLTVVKGVRALRAAKAAGASDDLAKAVAREAVQEATTTAAKTAPSSIPADAPAPASAAPGATDSVAATAVPEQPAGTPTQPQAPRSQSDAGTASPPVEEQIPGGPPAAATPSVTGTPAPAAATNTTGDVKELLGGAAQGMRDGFVDSAWSRISAGKRLPFGDKPGTLESKLQAAADAGLLKTRDDVAALVDQNVPPKAATPAAQVAKPNPAAPDNVIPFRKNDAADARQPEAKPVSLETANNSGLLDLRRRLAMHRGESVAPLTDDESARVRNTIQRRGKRLIVEAKEAGTPLSKGQIDEFFHSGKTSLAPEQQAAIQRFKETRRVISRLEDAGIDDLSEEQLSRLRAGDPENEVLTAAQLTKFSEATNAYPPHRLEWLGRFFVNAPERLRTGFGETGKELYRKVIGRNSEIARNIAKDRQLLSELRGKGLTGDELDTVINLIEDKLPPEAYRSLDRETVDVALRLHDAFKEIDADALALQIVKDTPGGERLYSSRAQFFPHVRDTVKPQNKLEAQFRRQGTRSKSILTTRYAEDAEDFIRADRALDVVEKYLKDARTFLSDARHFGQDLPEVIEGYAHRAAQEGYDPSFVRGTLNLLFGTGAQHPKRMKRAVGLLNRAQSAASMSLSWISQLNQWATVATKAGLTPTLKATAEMVKSVKGNKAWREAAERSGAAIGDALDAITLSEASNSPVARLFDKMPHLKLFAQEDAALRLLAASTGPKYAEDLLRAVRGEDDWLRRLGGDLRTKETRIRQATDELRDMGVDLDSALSTGKLSEDDQLKAAWWLSYRTQFGTHTSDLPLLAASPAGRAVYLFRRWALSQIRFLSDEVVKPALSGNMQPLARFFTASLMTGSATTTAMDAVLGKSNWLLEQFRQSGESDESLGEFVFRAVGAAQLGLLWGLFFGSGQYDMLTLVVGKTAADAARLGQTYVQHAHGATEALLAGGLPGYADWADGKLSEFAAGEGQAFRAMEKTLPFIRQGRRALRVEE